MRARQRTWKRLLVEHATPLVVVGLALYALVRGYLKGYTAEDLPFLLSLLVGLIGLLAVDSFVERKLRLGDLDRQLGEVAEQNLLTHQVNDSVHRSVNEVRLAVNALQLGATAGNLLTDEHDIPRQRLQRARRIYWSGVTLRAKLRLRLGDLGAAIGHGADVSLLVLDPASTRLRHELTVREGAQYEFIAGVLSSMLLNLQALAEKLPPRATFELGFHQVFPSCGLVILDPEAPDGVCYVELYPIGKRNGACFVVHAATDPTWFKYFVDEFVALREKASVYDIRGPGNVDGAVQSWRNHAG